MRSIRERRGAPGASSRKPGATIIHRDGRLRLVFHVRRNGARRVASRIFHGAESGTSVIARTADRRGIASAFVSSSRSVGTIANRVPDRICASAIRNGRFRHIVVATGIFSPCESAAIVTPGVPNVVLVTANINRFALDSSYRTRVSLARSISEYRGTY